MPPLRLLRRRRLLTQADLGKQAGVRQETISLIESGSTEAPRPATMRRIAAALGVAPLDVDEFRRAVENEQRGSGG